MTLRPKALPSAFFRRATQSSTFEIPLSSPDIEELQRYWSNPKSLLHFPGDCEALAAMQDATTCGLDRMPNGELAVTSLIDMTRAVPGLGVE